MSVRAITLAWRYSRAEGAPLLVLLALADYANREGVAWPSTGQLAAKARTDRRTCQRAVRELERLGEIRRLRSGTGRDRALYRFTLYPPGVQPPLALDEPFPEGAWTEPGWRPYAPPGAVSRRPRGGPTPHQYAPTVSKPSSIPPDVQRTLDELRRMAYPEYQAAIVENERIVEDPGSSPDAVRAARSFLRRIREERDADG